MKKLYTLFFIFFISISYSNSQWVTIPDANFAAFLQQNYPQCMNGNLMDTTCSAIVNETYLICSSKNISDLTGIEYFTSLNSLNCSNNQLTQLNSLPLSLEDLQFQWNNLTSLPTLPSGLKYLSCGSNQLSSLQVLPSNLISLNCSGNPIFTLPTLPSSLLSLSCSGNSLNFLPNLPSNLEYLDCAFNNLTTLPPLPNSITTIFCEFNQLTYLPDLPDSLFNLWIVDNPIECLPKLKKIVTFMFMNTNISCIPNNINIPYSNPILNSLPLCDIFNNPNNCDFFWSINGKVYGDANSNCTIDTGEPGISNLKLHLLQNGNLTQQTYSVGEGTFSFDTDTGTFTYTVDTTDLPVLVTCPVSGFHTSILTPVDSMDYNMDFAMQCKPGFDVGVKNILRTSGQFFPGNTATVKIGAGDMASYYGLTCAAGVSGSITVNFTGPITFISEAPGALVPSVSGNTLTYTIPDFGLVNFNSDFRIIVKTDTTAQAGQQVCFIVNLTPTTGDNDISNNSLQHCFSVVNSFDPNAKEVFPEGGITPSQEWMTYTIHFQNTGNAPAQNIYILDTLDNNLIASSFTLLSYSHHPLTQLFGNVIKFNFPNINLPDSTNDEPNSHGFVQYKIKLNPNLPIGTIISNIAYNFFDFNSPVATNSVSNTVGLTSVIHHSEKVDISVFPNPTTNDVNISFNLNSNSEVKIELYNSLGQIVNTIPSVQYPTGKHLIHLSPDKLPAGIYHLKATVNNQPVMKKIVKY